ncbi:hypothetical protein [Bradyrhizobium brasilense]|uniref:hypothetical protein n=1 Tax=Bradyrhizobium brasilense TaxID=1419277 RepID=UPI001F18B79D|nr:hypothetical protein [Bradyrhizobium brasilense]
MTPTTSAHAHLPLALSRHRGNIRRSVNVLLKADRLPVTVLENVGPFVRYSLACFLCPRRECTQDHDGVALLNHLTRRELAEFQILANLDEEVCNLLLSLEGPGPRQFVLGTRGYPRAVVIDQIPHERRNVTTLKGLITLPGCLNIGCHRISPRCKLMGSV